MFPNLTNRQKELLTGIAIIGAFGGVFLSGELALRLSSSYKFGVLAEKPNVGNWETDDQTGMTRFKPGLYKGRFPINEAGYRGELLEVPKPPGTIRMAFMGTSTTLDLRGDWPRLTKEALSEKFPGCKFEHINAGSPMLTVDNAPMEYEHFLQKFDPDIIIVRLYGILRGMDEFARNAGVHTEIWRQRRRKPDWLGRHSKLWETFSKEAKKIRKERTFSRQKDKIDLPIEDLAREYARKLEYLVRTIQADQRAVMLVAGGRKFRLSQTHEERVHAAKKILLFREYLSIETLMRALKISDRTLRDVSTRTGAELLDVTDVIPADQVHFMDAVHYSALGSKLMARTVMEQLAVSSTFLKLLAKKSSNCQNGP